MTRSTLILVALAALLFGAPTGGVGQQQVNLPAGGSVTVTAPAAVVDTVIVTVVDTVFVEAPAPPTDTVVTPPIPPVVLLPGPSGTPQFVVVTGGVRAFWTPGVNATSYRTTGNGISASTVSATARLLPVNFTDWFCAAALNSAGAAEQMCARHTATAPPPDTSTAPPTEPPTGGGGGAWFTHQWGTTLSVGGNVSYIHGSTNSIQTGPLIDGSSGRYLRSASNGGYEYQHGVDLVMPQAQVTRPRELWIEVGLRYSGSGWANSVDDKSLFVILNTESFEWRTFLRGGSFYGGPYPRPGATPGDWIFFDSSPSTLFNAQWHRLRHHVRMDVPGGSCDGAYRVWIDVALVINRTNLCTANPSGEFFQKIALGRNSYVTNGASRDWGTVRVYTTNPGW